MLCFRQFVNSCQLNSRNNTSLVCYNILRKSNLQTSVNKLNFSNEKPFLKCWKCGKEQLKNELFCLDCNTIQKPYETRNYFKIFQINDNFIIDTKLLSKKYRKMQSLLHPDKFTNMSEIEKAVSADYSALINKAYHVLLNSIKRANHLLELKGEKINEESVSDPEFLMEMMELNEQIDCVGNTDELRQLNDKVRKKMDEIFLEIARNFQENDIKKAKDNLVKIKYFNNISFRINSILREKGIVD